MSSSSARVVAGVAAVSCAALCACAQTASAAGPARMVSAFRAFSTGTPEVSTNWSGYAVTAPGAEGDTGDVAPEAFSDVVGTWVEPKAACRTGATTASAFWVGLGGFSQDAPALEQIGTEADCTPRGKPGYSAWFEIVPAAAVTVKLKVHPGDTISAAVLVNGQQITFSLRNVTRHTRFSKRVTTLGTLDVSSAEWIAEAPSECDSATRCHVLPLTNFGTVAFTKASTTAAATTTAAAHDGTISDPAWEATPLELASDGDPFSGSSTAGAIPADLSPDGASFSVSWQKSVQPPPG